MVQCFLSSLGPSSWIIIHIVLKNLWNNGSLSQFSIWIEKKIFKKKKKNNNIKCVCIASLTSSALAPSEQNTVEHKVLKIGAQKTAER